MNCDRFEVLIVFQWSSRAVVCVSCVFCGCLRCWIVVLDPQLGFCEGVVLHVFCECFVIVCVCVCLRACVRPSVHRLTF